MKSLPFLTGIRIISVLPVVFDVSFLVFASLGIDSQMESNQSCRLGHVIASLVFVVNLTLRVALNRYFEFTLSDTIL